MSKGGTESSNKVEVTQTWDSSSRTSLSFTSSTSSTSNCVTSNNRNQSGGAGDAWCGATDPLGGTRLPFARFPSSSSLLQQQRLPWWSAKTSGTRPLGGSRWLSVSVFLCHSHIHVALNTLELPNSVGATGEEPLYTQVLFVEVPVLLARSPIVGLWEPSDSSS